MTALTLSNALMSAKCDWFYPGDEPLRADAISWLKKPCGKIPEMIKFIANNNGIPMRIAIGLARLMDDQESLRKLENSKGFASLRLSALIIWEKAHKLYQSRLHASDSSGASDSKIINGSQTRNGVYKPGLPYVFDDEFTAYAAYFMAFGGGFKAAKAVRAATGWSTIRIRGILTIAIREIHSLHKDIGLRALKALDATITGGKRFIRTVCHMMITAKTSKAKNTKTKVKVKSGTDTTGQTDTADVEDHDDTNPTMDGRHNGCSTHDDDSDDPAHPDPDAQQHRAIGCGVLDSPDSVDQEDQEPEAKLKMGRELAFFLLKKAKENKGLRENLRFRDLINKIDDSQLVNAFQKQCVGPKDMRLPQMINEFLDLAWQWSARRGLFAIGAELADRQNLPDGDIIRQIAKAVQAGYWGSDQKDGPKSWVEVMDVDEIGRKHITRLERPTSPDIKVKPHVIIIKDEGGKVISRRKDGRMIIIEPDFRSLDPIFFTQTKTGRPKSNDCVRYFRSVSTDGQTEIITCMKVIHSRKSPLDNALNVDDLEDNHGVCLLENIQTDGDSASDFSEHEYNQISEIIGMPIGDIKLAVIGNQQKLEEIYRAALNLPEDQKEEHKVLIKSILHTSRAPIKVTCDQLDARDRRTLSRILNMDLRTLERSLERYARGDNDAERELTRAIKSMPISDRNLAVQILESAGKRHRTVRMVA
ncbi:hypothetical protein HAP94_19360 [Acidithiobacillus ferrivorans]|nr:hypothetical protein [Acidithiobacillus ferrivorans]